MENHKNRTEEYLIEATILDLLKTVFDTYDFNPITLAVLRFFFRNPYESTIIVDKNSRVQFMDKASERFLGIEPGSAKGLDIREFVPQSGLPKTLETGIPQIGRVFEVKGQHRIGAVYPIKRQGGEIVGGLGRLMFYSFEEVERMNAEVQRLKKQLRNLRQKGQGERTFIYMFTDILGNTKSIQDTISMAQKISQVGVDVLITGESGTGKELFAHSIHSYSNPEGPFIKLNCPAIPFELAESELFGYEKGAFTGALSGGKVGAFEMADEGTIFLDEISSLPLSIQAKILRVLQEREVTRLGSTKTKQISFRLIVASNMDLKQLVKEEKFREDLFYRVAKAEIRLPPLRDRREDIPLYVNHFLKQINRSFKMNIKGISERAMEILKDYSWPGNMRELINVLEQAAIRAWNVEKITEELLPKDLIVHTTKLSKKSSAGSSKSIKEEIRNIEREFIISVLKEVNGNKKRAAALLSMPRSTLYQKIARYNIEV